MLPRRRRIRAAGGFLLFLVALMPLTLVGVALSADYTRALLAKRQATNAADVIAMAAATAIVDTTSDEVTCAAVGCTAALSARVRIDDAIAEERAKELFDLAETTGMLPENLEAQLDDVSVCPRGDLTCRGGQEVSVTITYKVPSFFVIRIITADDGETVSGEVVRSAEICDPADLERGAGAGCAYPLGG